MLRGAFETNGLAGIALVGFEVDVIERNLNQFSVPMVSLQAGR